MDLAKCETLFEKSHFMILFKKCLRLWQIHDLCISKWKNLIFSEGQSRKFEFLIFLPSSIILEVMKKKLATSSFPKYFYANSPDVNHQLDLTHFIKSDPFTGCHLTSFSNFLGFYFRFRHFLLMYLGKNKQNFKNSVKSQ